MLKKGDIVRHIVTGNTYVILHDPMDDYIIESTGESAFVYRSYQHATPYCWVRPVSEMVDGRFELVVEKPPKEITKISVEAHE